MATPMKTHPSRPRAAMAALLALLLALPGAGVSLAAPRGEQVSRGEVAFVRDGSLTIIQAGDGSIINYDSFDILAGETVQFIQPDEAARVLNRVLGFDPSHIDGSLLANGIVYIVNPAGVFFGGEAIVDVAGLVAAAGRIRDRDFLEGVDHFSDLAGAVENHGSIRAGAVALLGRSVANHGSIVARDGLIALVAGEDVILTRRDGHVVVHVDGPAREQATGVSQEGYVDAGQGEVILTTGDLYSLAINHDGITRGGQIELDGGSGLVQVAGTLDASNDESGGLGGRVHVLGERIAVLDAEIDASGAAGGGEIRIGGDFAGEGELRTASRTYVGPDAQLRADALEEGDGGTVVIWADESAGFYGELSARGGERGGDGGFAEISGALALEARGHVDLRAPEGATGTVLYDPQDIEIIGGAPDVGDPPDGDDSPDLQPDQLVGDDGTLGQILFADVGTGFSPFEIYESEIEGSDANIVLEAENSITVSGTFDNDADGAGTDDPGLNVVLIGSGNSLTMRTRNEAGDEVGSGETPGIDLTDGGALDALEFRTLGGDVTIRTGDAGLGGGGGGAAAGIRVGHISTSGGSVVVNAADGDVRIDSVDTSGASAAEDAGAITVRARGIGGVTIDATLTAVGADGLGAGEIGGRGGDVEVTAEDGDISVGPITTDGGDGDVGGGRGGDVAIGFAFPGEVGSVALTGPVSSRGGDVVTEGDGGRGGNFFVQTQQGAVVLPAVDVSGGDGMDAGAASDEGGNGGAITVLAAGDVDEGELPGSITIGGSLVSSGGSGTTEGSGSSIRLEATESLELAGALAGPHIVTDGDVTLFGRTVGASGSIEIDGGGTADSLLTLLVEGDANIDVVDAGFDRFTMIQLDATGDIDIAQAYPDLMDPTTTEVIDIDGAADTSTVRSIDLSTGEGGASYFLRAEDADLVIESGAVILGGPGSFESQSDLVLEGGANPAVTTGDAPLIFQADADDDGIGDIEVTAGTAPHVVGMGNMEFSGAGVGANQTIRVDAGGVVDSRLDVRAGGDVNLAVEAAGFNVLDLRQSDGSADLLVTQDGGDVIEIAGAPGGAADAPAVSTVVQLDTRGNAPVFAFTLRQPDPDGVDPTLVVPTGIVEFGSSGSLISHGDLTLGTTEGTGIRVSTADAIVSLQADADRDGSGALRDGVAGSAAAEIALMAPNAEGEPMSAPLLLFGGQGVGEEGNPIQTSGIGSVAAEADVDGGIYLTNVESGDELVDSRGMLVTLVGLPVGIGQGVAQASGLRVLDGPGDIVVVNEAGSITIDGAIRTFLPGLEPLPSLPERDPTEGELTLRAGEGASIVFELKPDVGDNQQVTTSVVTSGHQTYESPILLGRPETEIAGLGNVVFTGSIESAGTDTDPDLDGEAPSLAVTFDGLIQVGDDASEDTVGTFEQPLGRFELSPVPDDNDPSTPELPEPNISINASLIATESSQRYPGPVTLGGITTFDSGGSVVFPSTLLGADAGRGGAIVNAAENVGFGGDVSLGLEGNGSFEVNLTGESPGVIEFLSTERVEAGTGGIRLNPEGRDEISDAATVFKSLVIGVPSDFPNSEIPEPTGVGPVVFETTGDFVLGPHEKLSIGDELTIVADNVTAGDIAALELTIDSTTYTVLGREPATVLLAGGGEITDSGTDIVANRITLEAVPDWDGKGTVPTFFTQTGGVKAPGSLEAFELRQIDAEGDAISLGDFFDSFGAALDLTGTGPGTVSNPATQTVEQGAQVAYLMRPRFSDEEPRGTSLLDAAGVRRFLDCADLGDGRPAGCSGAAPKTDRVLDSPRARETAAIWRELTGPGSRVLRGELRKALAGRKPGDGLALRRRLEAPPRDEATLAYLNRVDALLIELRMLNLSEAVSETLERQLLDGIVAAVGAPELDADTLGEAALSSRAGLVL